MKLLVALMGLALAAVLTAAAVSGPSGTAGPRPPAAASTYPSQTLAGASAMTGQMSAPGNAAHDYHLHAGDEQLRLSSDPAFVRQLEAYQADIDRMLARR